MWWSHRRSGSSEPATSSLDPVDRLLTIAIAALCSLMAGLVTSANWGVPFEVCDWSMPFDVWPN
jgi:hypothetical protein